MIKRLVHRLFHSQRNMAILYTLVMLVPNVFLAVTEPYGPSTVAASLLLPAGFYLAWCTVTRRPGAMILWSFPLMFLGAFQLVLLYLFGESIIAVDMITNLFTTNPSEAGELLGNIWPSVVGVCVLYLPLVVLGVWSLRLKSPTPARSRRRMALAGGLLMLAGLGMAGISELRNPAFALGRHIFPIDVLCNIGIAVDRWQLSNAYPQSSADFRFDARRTDDRSGRRIYLLVIGEASRAANWQLLGYERPTNPRLTVRDGIVPLRDMITQNNATHKSVPIILSSVSAENFDRIYTQKGICALFGEAGYTTLFITCQSPNRSLIDFLGHEAQHTVRLDPNEGHTDSDALPLVERAIDTCRNDLFILLHTYGSHFAYDKRYPAGEAHFTPDRIPQIEEKTRPMLVNAYDNSIRHTDRVLDRLCEVLERSGACSGLFYTSDHGEDIMDDARGRFLHASPVPTYYQLHVAALSWASPAWRAAYPDKWQALQHNAPYPVSTASVFHTMADMAGIDTPWLDRNYSLVSDEFSAPERHYLTDRYESVPFYNTGLKSYDFDQFDRRHIAYDRNRIVQQQF